MWRAFDDLGIATTDFFLHEPAQRDLRNGFALRGADIAYDRILDEPPASEWAISDKDQTELATSLDQLGLIEIRVKFSLQGTKRLRTFSDRFPY